MRSSAASCSAGSRSRPAPTISPGPPDRRAWDEELGRELSRADRDSGALCVAILDLDEFKRYNDSHGHQAGDRFLKQMAGAWSQTLRAGDILARYGGEEFALALPGTNLEHAQEMLERLRESLPEGQTAQPASAAGTARRARNP